MKRSICIEVAMSRAAYALVCVQLLGHQFALGQVIETSSQNPLVSRIDQLIAGLDKELDASDEQQCSHAEAGTELTLAELIKQTPCVIAAIEARIRVYVRYKELHRNVLGEVRDLSSVNQEVLYVDSQLIVNTELNLRAAHEATAILQKAAQLSSSEVSEMHLLSAQYDSLYIQNDQFREKGRDLRERLQMLFSEARAIAGKLATGAGQPLKKIQTE